MNFIPDELDDDMDDFGDYGDVLDGDLDSDSPRDNIPSPMAWRKSLIEKAVAKVKKAKTIKVDTSASYTKGTMLFDKESNRFARVSESKPGFLSLNYVSGGSLIKQDLNPLEFIKENRAKMTLIQLAERLKVSETEVVKLFNQIELESEKSTIKFDDLKAHKKAPPKTSNMAKTLISKEVEIKKDKKHIKFADKKVDVKINKSTEEVFLGNVLPKGAVTDPIMDPNGYIKQTFMLMSNKQLAVATGLSEHTIRRKLGEWGLKRKP